MYTTQTHWAHLKRDDGPSFETLRFSANHTFLEIPDEEYLNNTSSTLTLAVPPGHQQYRLDTCSPDWTPAAPTGHLQPRLNTCSPDWTPAAPTGCLQPKVDTCSPNCHPKVKLVPKIKVFSEVILYTFGCKYTHSDHNEPEIWFWSFNH